MHARLQRICYVYLLDWLICLILKVKISEKTSVLEEAEKRIVELTSKVEEQQKLILKLEDDILKVGLHAHLIIHLIPVNSSFLQLFIESCAFSMHETSELQPETEYCQCCYNYIIPCFGIQMLETKSLLYYCYTFQKGIDLMFIIYAGLQFNW